MLITKLIEVGLTIKDCINAFSSDDYIMRLLRDKYENVCIAGCLVLSIRRIVRLGECVLSQGLNIGSGTVSVTFEVDAIVLYPGEILAACRIINVGNGTILCEHKYASVILPQHDMLRSIKVGQLINVAVIAPRYEISSSRISVAAEPHLPTAKCTAWFVRAINPAALADVVERMEELEKELSMKDKRAVEFFKKIMYSYKAQKPLSLGATKFTIGELIKGELKDVYVSRDSKLDLFEPTIVMHKKEPNDPNVTLGAMIKGDDVVRVLAEHYMMHLRLLLDIIDACADPAVLKANANLWAVYNMAKLE